MVPAASTETLAPMMRTPLTTSLVGVLAIEPSCMRALNLLVIRILQHVQRGWAPHAVLVPRMHDLRWVPSYTAPRTSSCGEGLCLNKALGIV